MRFYQDLYMQHVHKQFYEKKPHAYNILLSKLKQWEKFELTISIVLKINTVKDPENDLVSNFY